MSPDSVLLLGILCRAYPWARYVSRSRGHGAKLREEFPEANLYGGFTSDGREEELPAALLPEIAEGSAAVIEELLEGANIECHF